MNIKREIRAIGLGTVIGCVLVAIANGDGVIGAISGAMTIPIILWMSNVADKKVKNCQNTED